jgi:hypothetical protein
MLPSRPPSSWTHASGPAGTRRPADRTSASRNPRTAPARRSAPRGPAADRACPVRRARSGARSPGWTRGIRPPCAGPTGRDRRRAPASVPTPCRGCCGGRTCDGRGCRGRVLRRTRRRAARRRAAGWSPGASARWSFATRRCWCKRSCTPSHSCRRTASRHTRARSSGSVCRCRCARRLSGPRRRRSGCRRRRSCGQGHPSGTRPLPARDRPVRRRARTRSCARVP